MSPSIETLHTARLVGKRVTQADLEDMLRMESNAEVMRTIGGVKTQEKTIADIDSVDKHWEQHGFGLWMFRLPTDGTFICRGMLLHFFVDGVDEVEMGYTVMPEFWGQGYATEVAELLLDVALRRINLPSLIACAMTTNHASQRVMKKIGMRYEKDIVDNGVPHVLFRSAA